jgi:hypothetical protein
LSSQQAAGPVGAPKRNSSIRPSIAFGEISTKPDGGQIGVAATIVSAEIGTLDDDEVTTSLLYGFEAGARFTGKGFGAAVGYYNRTWDVDSVTFTDMPVPLTLVGQNQSFDGFMITVNVRW